MANQTGAASVRVAGFRGLNQYGDGVGTDMRYAVDCANAQTREGVLRPMARCEMLTGALPRPIETLARLHRRWYSADGEQDVLIAASDGQLYWALRDAAEWFRIPLPPDWPKEYYESSEWSCVTYEINPEGSEAPVDVLLMSNADDGMILIRGDDLSAHSVATPKKFGVIARHAERIWGGGIKNDPDMLVYSAPFDPFDWEQNSEAPEDGAGDVLQPSWDGDSFAALIPFGSQLLALKRTRLWRVWGTHPGEYVFQEQFGGGTQYAKTVAVDGTRVWMLGRDGLLQYDGEQVAPYEQTWAGGIFARMNLSALSQAAACMHKGTYYCALPLDGAGANNAVLMYNTAEKTWLLREDISVEAFLSTEETLYFTSAETPGRVWRWRDDCWREEGGAEALRWIGPWNELNAKDTVKGCFAVYLTVESRGEAALDITLETEKKKKTRRVVCAASAVGQQKRLLFGGSGRRFRLGITSEAGEPWRLVGGVQIEAETDAE